MLNSIMTITLPFSEACRFFIKLFKAGYDNRTEHFEAARSSGPIDLDAYNENGYFGYFEYPEIYSYSAPKGFRGPPRPKKNKNPRNAQRLATQFFSSVICDFECEITSPSLDLELHGKIKASDIVDKLIKPLTFKGEPATVLVKGQIGCGKSTLLSAAMYSMWAEDDHTAKVVNLPIKIDLRETLKNLVDPGLQDDFPNDENFCDNIEKFLCQRIGSCLHKIGIKVRDQNPNFNDILDECNRRNVNPIIILDELDTIYYSFCLARADPSRNEITHHKMFLRYSSLVSYFLGLSKNKIRNLTNSPIVIIAARTSTVKLIEEVCGQHQNLGNTFSCPYPRNEIFITAPRDQRAREIIESWVRYYLNSTRGGKEEQIMLRNNFSEILDQLTTLPVPDLSKNLLLSVHGLRHIMKVLGKALIIDGSGRLLRSYICNPDLLRIYQYLDGCEYYSQTTEGVSNIFLVNDEFKSQNEKVNEYIPRSLYRGHLHTYWLKYFLLRYICYRQREAGPGELLMSNVLETFCISGAKDENPKQFEREVVFLAILHATEVTHGRLLKLGTNSSGPSTKIIASKRAALFDSDDLYWEFQYLFVCTEDDWLRFPKGVAEYFAVSEPWQRSYNFVTSFHSLSNDDKLRFIKYKAKTVLAFIVLLEIALRRETRRYSKVFERLSDIDKDHFQTVGYVKRRREQVLRSIFEFVRTYVGAEYVDEITKYTKNYLASSEYGGLRRKIVFRYSLYDRLWNSLRKTSTHMRAYHRTRLLDATR